ncbi:hypothetical protein [Paraburkholderia sp. SIMBA_054]|uniref:hypothetical protein n=1 Tax=Paraburkholderia sp. SIMBA_054 TaxID=3085795 RepID=UPI00397B74D6
MIMNLNANEAVKLSVVARYVDMDRKWYLCHAARYQNAFRNEVNGFGTRGEAVRFAEQAGCAVEYHEYDRLQVHIDRNGQKKSTRITSGNDPDAAIDDLSAAMPEDRSQLLDAAMRAVEDLHAAVLALDEISLNSAADRYDAAVLKLNGGTSFGCNDPSNPEAGGTLAENHCRAAPGLVPKWGQRGEFLITVSGIPAVVEVDDGFRRFYACFRFHVVNPHGPFISETGFRSHFEGFEKGKTVEQVAITVFSALLAEEGHRMLTPEYRDRRANEPVRPWLDASKVATMRDMAFEEPGGQFALGF